MKLRVAKIVCGTEAEGPGLRSALWLQGCPLRCANCCNPEMLKDTGGELIDRRDVLEKLVDTNGIEGITILGGEPFAQAEATAKLAQMAQAQGLSVMVFSGFTLADLRERNGLGTNTLLANIDILVDGPYDGESPDKTRRWIGSQNQVMHFLSERYDAKDPCFLAPNTVEIRYKPGRLTVNGWPAAALELDPRRRDAE